MKRLLTAAAITFGLLTGTAAHAAPTCHQKVTVAGLEYLNDTVPVSTKVSKMVREQALDLISSSADDYNAKAVAYVTAVATATADVLKAAVSDEIKDLVAQTADTMVTSFGLTDKFQKDRHVADGLKNAAILDAKSKIITAFFACKPTLPLPGSAIAVESPKDTAKAMQPEAKAPPLPDSAMAVESPKDTAKAVQPEAKAERAAVPKTSTVCVWRTRQVLQKGKEAEKLVQISDTTSVSTDNTFRLATAGVKHDFTKQGGIYVSGKIRLSFIRSRSGNVLTVDVLGDKSHIMIFGGGCGETGNELNLP